MKSTLRRVARMLLMIAVITLPFLLSTRTVQAEFEDAHWDKTVARFDSYEYFNNNWEYHLRLWEATDSGEVPIEVYDGTTESYINLGGRTSYDVRDFFADPANSKYIGKKLRFKVDLYHTVRHEVITYITSEDAVFCEVPLREAKGGLWPGEWRGTAIAKVGSTMEMPAMPSFGYEQYFAGWANSIDGTEMWDFRTDVITEDPPTLYVKWLPKTETHSHDGITFLPWPHTDKLPVSGSYYLLYDVKLSEDAVPEGKLDLCLNGHTVSPTGEWIRSFTIKSGADVALYDDEGKHGALIGYDDWRTHFDGGVVLIEGGSFTLNSGHIKDGFAYHYGGNIYMTSGKFTMNGGLISNGKAINHGGGVAVTGGSFVMNGGAISNNLWRAPQDLFIGGGVYIEGDGTFHMAGGEIVNNTAIAGAGVYADEGKNISISGGTIANNDGESEVASGFHYRGDQFRIVAGKDGIHTDRIIIKDNMSNDCIWHCEGYGELMNSAIRVEAIISADSIIGVSSRFAPKQYKEIPARIPITTGMASHKYAGDELPFYSSDDRFILIEDNGEAYITNYYTITYSPGEHGSGYMGDRTARVIDGENYNVEEYGFTAEQGYKFAGWKADNEIYQPGELKVEKNYYFTAVYEKSCPDGHTWNEGVVTKEPKCTEQGEKTYTCTVCGAEKTEKIDAVEHSWALEKTETTGSIVKEIYKCSRCGMSYEVTRDADHEHGQGPIAFSEEIPATCTENGTKAHTVCGCGAKIRIAGDKWTILTDEELVIPALGHDYREIEGTNKAATCTEPGKKADLKCSVCGVVTDGENIPALGHDWGEWVITKASTWTEKGSKTRKCVRCDEAETKEILPRSYTFKIRLTNKNLWRGTASVSKTKTFEGDAVTVTVRPKGVYSPKVTVKSTEDGSIYIDDMDLTVSRNAFRGSFEMPAYPVTVIVDYTGADDSGSVQDAVPMAKLTSKGSSSLTISWNSIDGADGYDIFMAKGGKKATPKRVKTIKGNKTFTWTKKSLKKKTAYKAYVRAWVMDGSKKVYGKKSPVVYAYTSGGTNSYTNAKSVTVKKTKVSLKKGKTYKVRASVKKLRTGRKLMPKSYASVLRYRSSNSKVAAVSKGGKIKAVKKGTCYVYVYAHNGVFRKIKITVK